MNRKLIGFCEELEGDIKSAYESSVSIEESEKLAAKFLHGSLVVAAEIQTVDLDRRMKKSGLKTVKATVYLEAATAGDKKPSDKLLEAVVDTNELVNKAQDDFDQAEVYYNRLSSYMSVFHEAHIHFRTIAKGSFNG